MGFLIGNQEGEGPIEPYMFYSFGQAFGVTGGQVQADLDGRTRTIISHSSMSHLSMNDLHISIRSELRQQLLLTHMHLRADLIEAMRPIQVFHQRETFH